MKKLLSAIAACLTAGALMAGCGDSQPVEQKSENVSIGIIAGLNVDEERFNNSLHSLGIYLPEQHFVYYDSLNALQLGLESGSVDEISVYESVADYLLARNPDLALTDAHKAKIELSDNFCCAVKSDNKELLGALDGAIKSMKDDGTLDGLTKKYIDDVEGEPEAVAMPVIDGAETIKVAVTGDLPPLDLITADGKPAGFNTAVLSEISRRINKNFELVSVDGAARAAVLSSDKVDMIFWVRVPKVTDRLPVDYDCPEGISVTIDYYEDEIVHVGKK